jgi:Ca2+-binding RTX toxin-like protein
VAARAPTSRLKVGALALLSLAAALALPAGASAAEAARLLGTNNVLFEAAPNELNDLTVALEGTDHTFEDSSAPVTPGNGCFAVTAQKVRCPAQPDDSLLVLLKDGADRGSVTSPFDVAQCGGIGNDSLEGGPGGGVLLGEEGDDILTGGPGFDLLFAETDCEGVPSDLPPGENVLDAGAGNDIVEAGEGDDSLDGGEGDDSMFAYGGDDILEGGEGDDTLTGYAGADSLSGGQGNDLLGGGDGNDSLAGGPGDDQLSLTYVRNGVVYMDKGDDLLDGGSGDDLLNGGPGSRFLNFGLEGGIDAFETDVPNGRDDLRGGDGRDRATYAKFSAAVEVTQDDVANDGSADEGDNVHSDVESVQGGSGDDTLFGTTGADDLDGSRGSDEVYGGAGDDSLSGGVEDGGADRLEGGDGDDSLGGGAGGDMLRGQSGRDSVAGGGGSDVVAGGEDADALTGGTGLDSLSGGPGNDDLDGAEAALVGADGADGLAGGPGDDNLKGGPGDDRLGGGPGSDSLAGEDGHDTADYGSARRAVDVTFDDVANDGEPGERDNVRSDVEGASGGGEPDTFTGNSVTNVLAGGAGEDFADGGGGLDDLRGGAANDTLRSRDGRRDRVACGAGRDMAIADPVDRVLPGCELVDRGGARPVLGRASVLRPARGRLGLSLPGTERFVPLRDRVRVPFGSVVDAGAGAVRVLSASSRQGGRRSATVSGGRFRSRQQRRRGAVTELSLAEAVTARCRRGARGRDLPGLRTRSRAGFRTRGRRATATGRRAEWSIQERCDGTLVRVRRGRVRVVDLRRKRRLILRAGGSYLARAR